MNQWQDTTLGNILQFQRGFDITKKEQKEGDIPVISSSGMSSFHNESKVKGPGVVIGRKGTLGTVHYVETDYWPHDTTLWIKDFKGNSPKFLFYFLKTIHLENYDTGSSNPTLNRNHIHKIKLRFPSSPSIQGKVTAILSAYDELIENGDRRIALLEKIAEEIYREWFVRLRFPGYQQTTFHKGIPEGWERKRFDEFCTLQRGFDITKKEQKEGNIPIVSSSGIKSFHNEAKVKGPGVITGRKGTLGKVYFLDSDYWPHDTTLCVKNTKGNSLYVIYYFLKSIPLEIYDAGASNPTLNRNHLGRQYLFVPSPNLQKSFEAKIKPIFRQKQLLERGRSVLQQTRDRLLTRLISGKLSVEDLDIHFLPSMDSPEEDAHD